MLKKLFVLLALFAFLSLACSVVLLLYRENKILTYIINKEENRNEALDRLVKDRVKELMQMKVSKAEEETFDGKLLGFCPNEPPGLVGPLLVEFNYQRTMEEVKKELAPQLQLGGRFKPPDCITPHKVGK